MFFSTQQRNQRENIVTEQNCMKNLFLRNIENKA